jgi:hypothetical protein
MACEPIVVPPEPWERADGSGIDLAAVPSALVPGLALVRLRGELAA